MTSALRLGRVVAAVAVFGLGLSACCKKGGSGIQSSSGEPQIQTGGGVSSSSPSQATVDFGDVPVGQKTTLTLKLSNVGIASLNILKVEVTKPDPEFTVDVQEGAQVGSEPLAIPIRFLPFTTGPKTATVVLQTDSADVPTVTLNLSGTGVKLALSVVPEAIDFGKVVVQTTATQSIAITNASGVSLTLTLSALQGAQAPLFALGSLAATTIAPSQTVQLQVSYSPVVKGPVPDTAYFTLGYCTGCNPLTVNLRGEPVDTGLSVSPMPLDFGFVQLGGAVSKIIKLQNVANRSIHLTNTPLLDTGHPAAAFAFGSAMPAFPAVIPANGEVDVPVVFTPPGLAEFKGSVVFTSDDPQASQVTVNLDGFGGGAQISCLPSSVAFGQSPIGVGVTQRVQCTNVGQDVPGHPEGNLQLSSLAVPDDKAFSAHFDAPFPTAGLQAGQSAVIDVVYAAVTSAGDLGHLHIGSNDTTTPDTVVPLSGTGVNLPPCDFAIVPAAGVDFGHVDKGNSGQLQFAIQNQGASDCLVDGLSLAPSSDPSFSLPSGPIASQVVSYKGNPAGAPAELDVTVQFAPTGYGNFSGDAVFTISDPSSPQQDVHLTGTSEPGCLLIAPNDLDFGVVGVNPATGAWCSSVKRNFEVYNTCNYDVHLTGITLNPGIGSTDFVLSGQPASYPVDLPPGSNPVTFQVAFHPDSQGQKLGSLGITTKELPTAPYLVTFHGDAEVNATQTDTFTQSSQPQVDILWVVDNDDNQQVQQLVAQNLPSFMQYALSAGIDFHMAVTATDVCQTGTSDDGWFDPCSHCAEMGSNATIVTPQTQPDPTSVLQNLIQVGQSGGCDDPLFEPAYEALQPSLLSGHNSGFLRPNAYLAVIGISDGDDNSQQSVQFYYNFFESVKGFRNASMFSFSAVNELPTDSAGGCSNGLAYDDDPSQVTRVPQMVQMTGGLNVDICTSDWGSSLQQLGNIAFGARTSFPLTAQPADPTKITVTLNGQPLPPTGPNNAPEWHYDPTQNALVFDPLAAPQPGDQITVTYTVACN